MATARVNVVLVTCPTAAVAKRLAATLVRQRVAACVNVLPGVVSVYEWKGVLERSRETLLIVKTTSARLDALKRAVLKQHPYDVPELIALPVTWGHRPYLAWVARGCQI